MTEGITLNELVIEVTRKCNARCDHCMRGESQNITFDPGDPKFHVFLKQLNHVGTLSFTGGEPSLAVHVIKGIRSVFRMMQVSVDDFYVVTNGLTLNISFIKEMLEWWCFVGDGEMSAVQLSNDEFHPEPNEKQVQLLSGLKFFSFRESEEKGPYRRRKMGYDTLEQVIAQGRGYNIGGTCHNHAETFELDMEERTVGGTLYLNALGKIIGGCDWSYDSQLSQEICSMEDDLWEELVDQFGKDEQPK